MMKEQMDFMMNAFRGRVSSDLDNLVHRTDSPFTASISSFPLPPKFQMPQVESYDGSKDPLDHLESFKFSRLTPNSIGAFKELSVQFASHFIWGHRYKKSTECLMNIKQREDETLRSYIALFNKEAFSIYEVDDEILIAVLTNELRKGKFLFSLYKNDAKTMSDVLYRATKYMNVEDALLAREEKPQKRERQEETR